MMKSSRVILSCLVSIVLATAASAAWVPLTGSPVSIGSLPGGHLIFGDKEFSEIELFGIGTGGAIDPNVNSVFVQGGQDNATGDYGLRFLLSWNAGSGQTVNATINFKISVLPGRDEYIKDVWMYLTGVGAGGTGAVIASENVWDAFPGGTAVASLYCSYDANGVYLKDHAEFAPLKEIWIRSKGISITGGTNGTAGISEFFQFYSQVPEPATITLLGVAGAIMLRKRRA